jgi:hypothetical protein
VGGKTYPEVAWVVLEGAVPTGRTEIRGDREGERELLNNIRERETDRQTYLQVSLMCHSVLAY